MDKLPKSDFSWGYAIFVILALSLLAMTVTGLAAVFSGSAPELESGNVAVIPVNGIILVDDDDYIFESATSSTDIVELIEKADKNSNIKAIVFEINSPGGSAVASEEIANAVKKTNKTTVAWIRESGASGAYWVASATDYIVANRVSITGSIGVIASYLEFSGTLDRYNVTYQRLVSGRYKDIGSPFRDMTSEEKEIFQNDLDKIRDYFVDEVAKNRKLSRKEIDKAANGLFYLGVQAKDLGLVDELGGKDEVEAYIQKQIGEEVEFVEYKKKEGFFELFSEAMGKQSFLVGKGLGSAIFEKGELKIRA